MKKIICILLCCCLCGCLFGCGDKETKTDVTEYTPPAQNQLFAKDVSGAVGDTVEMIFELGKDTKVAAADFTLQYDKNLLEYVSTKQLYKLQSGYIVGESPVAGIVNTAIVTLDYPTEGGNLFSVSFKILKDCKEGSNVGLSCSSCCDNDFKKFDLECKGAKVFSK